MISRFFAYDFDYENLSLRISEGGVLPRRTKNPFIQKVKKEKKEKKKGKTRAPNVKERVEASEPTNAEPKPTSLPKSEAQVHEKESKRNNEAGVGASAQENHERPEQTVEPSEVVGTLEEGVIVEVGLTLLECA